MKKISLLFIALIISITLFGCSTKNSETIVEEEKVPVRFSEEYLLVSKKYSSLEEITGKRIGYNDTIEGDVVNYVVEEIKNSIETSDDTFYLFDDYINIPNILDQMDAYIIPKDVHESIITDYRYDYKPGDFKVLATYEMPYYEEETVDAKILNNKLYTEPFAVMIDGLDGEGSETKCTTDSNAFLRNDVNHLMIVDPTRNHITMISFPRDSFVLNNKTGRRDKLTHHGLNGVENIKASIGGLLECDIPYYMQVSFGSFVHMINLFGGVTVDVPLKTHMDMDSMRNVAQPYDIPKGVQLLYGEEALALSRNRKYANIYNSDQGRLRNQALIITSLIKKIADHPKVLDVAHANWWFDYVTCNNFADGDLDVLLALAKKFSNEGYTVDNYFVDGSGDMAGDMYVLRLYDSSIEIAKGKYQLAMTGTIDKDNSYYDEIMTGWINRGTGTYEDGYLGESYDLHEIFGLENPNTENTEEVSASEE